MSWPQSGAACGLRTQPVFVSVSAGTSVLWWLYIDHRLSGNDTSTKTSKDSGLEDGRDGRDGRQTLLVYAAAATVFTVSPAPPRALSRTSVPAPEGTFASR